MLDAHARRMQRCAVYYAELGFCVFPVKHGGKFPYKDTRGELNGSDDPAFVREVWEAFPGANIGWALRYHPGCFVLDVDARNGGNEWLARRPPLPSTISVATPSGNSAHHWLRPSVDIATIGARGLEDTCGRVDIKGLPYGYVLLPPSQVKGKEYRWIRSPREAELEECPEWLESEIWHSKRTKQREDRGAVRQHRLDHGDCRSLVVVMRELGYLGPQLRPGVWLARCPNERQHSDRRKPFSGDTLVFEPCRPGAPGWLYCAHSHCQDIMKEILR